MYFLFLFQSSCGQCARSILFLKESRFWQPPADAWLVVVDNRKSNAPGRLESWHVLRLSNQSNSNKEHKSTFLREIAMNKTNIECPSNSPEELVSAPASSNSLQISTTFESGAIWQHRITQCWYRNPACWLSHCHDRPLLKYFSTSLYIYSGKLNP